MQTRHGRLPAVRQLTVADYGTSRQVENQGIERAQRPRHLLSLSNRMTHETSWHHKVMTTALTSLIEQGADGHEGDGSGIRGPTVIELTRQNTTRTIHELALTEPQEATDPEESPRPQIETHTPQHQRLCSNSEESSSSWVGFHALPSSSCNAASQAS